MISNGPRFPEAAMKRLALALVLASGFLSISCYVFDGGSRIDLGGEWEFRRAGEEEWLRASVPGCVHTDLVANGLAGDPFFGANEGGLQELENEDWEYRTTFRLGGGRLSRGRADLVFEGLDTYAAVYLNDSFLLEADNMFRRWSVPCAGVLREGANELVVRFRSPTAAVRAQWEKLPCELPGGPRVLTRKAAYQYGWDWSPRFVTCGIWRPVYVRIWDGARIAEFSVTQGALRRERADLAAEFEIEAGDSMRVSLVVAVDGAPAACVEAELAPGINRRRIELSIASPELWWTNGLGKQRLYRVRGEVRAKGIPIDRAERRVGLRTVELVEEADSIGRSFYFKLNGVPLYMKGANWVPLDSFLGRASRDRYEYFVASAADASMNMLRVWGGGVYEDDAFYDLCDEYGILVWQDFMFACAMYPGDWKFLRSVGREAADNAKRLRGHPCLALWCGNNEIDEAWRNWGWQRRHGIGSADSARIWRDYEKLFHELLPSVVAEHDPGRPYVPSSPRFGRADPRSLVEGDSHYWGVWHDGEPFEAYREKVPRFMSEFGFQSFPAFESVARFIHPRDMSAESEAMLAHQKHPRGNETIREYMSRDYRMPGSFRDFTYVSQLLQAEGVRTGIEAERRAMPYCMGSLFWQLNDCWPAVSWSAVDYYGAPKALYYAARGAYAPILVSPVVEDGAIRVHVVSDLGDTFEGELVLEIVDFAGELVWARRIGVAVPPRSSACWFEESLERALRGRDERAVFLDAELVGSDGRAARNLLYFARPGDLDLPPVEYVSCSPPVIMNARRSRAREADGRPGPPSAGAGAAAVRYCSHQRGRVHVVEIESDVLVKNLWLDAGDIRGYFSDNYFDVVPGERVSVAFLTDERRTDMFPYIRLTSLVDTYRTEE
jgi:beta-mannosidase